MVLRILDLRSRDHRNSDCFAQRKPAIKNRRSKFAARGTGGAQSAQRELSVDAARDVIARGVSDVFTVANVESLESSIKSWCETWLQAKAIEAEESSHERYARIVERFTEFLGAKGERDLSTLQANDILRFRDREAKERSRATANLT